MTTWHIVPTGISILQKFDVKKWPDLHVTLADRKSRPALHAKYKPSPANISAEREGLLGVPLDLADAHIIFLSSDTLDGRSAARLNAVLWAADFGEATFGDVIPNVAVLVLTIKDLDPADSIKFRSGMAGLARFFRSLGERVDQGSEVVVHLSGGFKATIPYLIKLAELLQSKFAEQAPPPELTARIRWEGAAHTLPVPLQRIDLGHMWRELYSKLEPGERRLFGHGYLYPGAYGKNLTELGEAVAAFLPGPP